ncbi:MAG: flippase [Waterburya sp.]
MAKLSPGLQKIIHNVGWLSAEKALNMVLSFFVGIYVIRYLGAENFGKLSYSLSFVALFTAIAKLGLDNIVVRNVLQKEKLTQEILGTAFVLKLMSALVTFGLIGTAIWTFNDDSQIRWMSVIIAVSLVFDCFDVIYFWFQSQVMSRPIAIVRSIQLIFSSAAKLLFITLKLPLIAFAWLMLAGSVVRAIGMIAAYFQHRQSIFYWQLGWQRARELLKDSWPLILSGVMITIYVKIDQVMLGNMAGNQEVGNYAAAAKFSSIWYFVPTTICSSVFPAIIRAKERSKQEYYAKLQQLYDLMAWISLAIVIPVTFASGYLVTTLLGEEYAKAGEILALHIWAGPFVFLGVARSKWLVAENLTQFSFATTSLGAITNVLLNYFLIPSSGGSGAALATVISYGVASHIACIFYPPMFNSGWMLTKALLIPFRFRQNFIYLNSIKKALQ